MKKCSASINSIETFGLVDGPGIRTVIFFNGCRLRCKFCHNPETWFKTPDNMTSEELLQKIVRNKPYFERSGGGVTFSGGEPLLHRDFLLEICPLLKKENISIALDTSGVGIGRYQEILELVDLVLFDVKYASPFGYKELTGLEIEESEKFIKELNQSKKSVWIRQVIVPGIHDNEEYLDKLNEYLRKIKNIERIEFLPFHHLGFEKYQKMGLTNPLENTAEMDVDLCNQLYQLFMKKWQS